MRQPKKSQAGFSMIEMLIAVVILAVGLLGLAELQLTAMRVNSQSESILAAGALAQRYLEDVIAMDPGDPLFNADSGFVAVGGAVTVPGAGNFVIQRSVDADHQGILGLCLVTVRVEGETDIMTVLGARKRSVTVTTLKRST